MACREKMQVGQILLPFRHTHFRICDTCSTAESVVLKVVLVCDFALIAIQYLTNL